MRFLFALLAALLLAAPAHAQSQDSDKVFDDLFGTEPARVTGTRRASSVFSPVSGASTSLV
ncbi:hypothetical protein [Novosphingobium sp.]|uniref:hypothetical protein n=1 Tax=Novosphingobium sp. TaxID=1874826 RepID=UPI0026180564|nr:hypothetical protein [Novosphingobium sp.]